MLVKGQILPSRVEKLAQHRGKKEEKSYCEKTKKPATSNSSLDPKILINSLERRPTPKYVKS